MKYNRRKLTLLTAVLMTVGLWTQAALAVAGPGHEPESVLGALGQAFADNPFDRAMKAMSDELIDVAEPLVQELETAEPGSFRALVARARFQYLLNDFSAALETLNGADAIAKAGEMERVRWFEDLLRSTYATTQGHKKVTTSRGHFVLWVTPGPDEVLIPYADEALENAHEVYGELFGYRPTRPVHVHIYQRVEDLAAVSSLKVTEIQTSGTIALCKYNRLMITSPRDLLFGYDWLDTLAHEYIHYVIIKASNNTVPIWLHEGLAKFFENRWREAKDAVMKPTSQDLLAGGLEQNRLITFEQMSPSMAKLPSQEDTALAFAEVFTVMNYLKNRVGMEGIGKTILAMRNGKTDREAIELALGVSFDRFQEDWRKYLKTLDLVRLPGGYAQKLYFKNKNKNEDELESLEATAAKDHTYLGDLLRARKRYLGASKQYRKAKVTAGDTSPIIQSKLGATLIELGQYDEAIKELAPPIQYYPEYVLIFLHTGRAYLAKKDYNNAALYLERAVRLNPFDPDAHSGLLTAYQNLGNAELVKRAENSLRLLQ
ncbi:MAG: hypothetical protein HUU55_12965 [Myxococcales bacterium]|nr:hypothetical protein [Myxococcales bacterium]